MALPHQDRIDAGVDFDSDSLPICATSLDEVPSNTEELRFDCESLPHRRIRRFKNLRRVWLYRVNQAVLEDIVQFAHIQSLYIKGLTADDLTILNQLPRLRRLIITKRSKIQNIDWVAGLPNLESLAITGFSQVFHLDSLASLTKLSALGIEGSTYTPMSIESLSPLSGLETLRYLFITCLRTSDGSLKPLHSLKRLQVLECGAAYFQDGEFMSLHQALPKLRCEWFDMIERFGSTRAYFNLLKQHFNGHGHAI